MKQGRVILSMLLSIAWLQADRAGAQTYTTVYNFTGGSDGANPSAGLILLGRTLYGTAFNGGSSGNGTVFAVNTDGTGFTTLRGFLGANYAEGANPAAGLVLSSNTLYGTTIFGGSPGKVGTIFKINTNGGASFATVHDFTATSYPDGLNTDGADPQAGLIMSSNTLYGTAYGGGGSGSGAVFKLNTNGTGFVTLYSFSAAFSRTNGDGANPRGGLTLSGDTLFGTTERGGLSGNGTVFATSTNRTFSTGGTGGTNSGFFTNLHHFSATSGSSATNSDGANPYAGVILSGNTLYGTTRNGGTGGRGTVFAVNTDGTGFTVLHSFSTTSGSIATNSDGAFPEGGLVLSGNTLYGTARDGGAGANGTVFAVNIDGTGFTVLHNCNYPEGVNPQAGLILSGMSLYGTMANIGAHGGGTIFSLSFAPQLSIAVSGTNLILTWPTNFAGFDYTGYALQFTTNPVLSGGWAAVSPVPVVINGLNTVTNAMSGNQQFYRLSR